MRHLLVLGAVALGGCGGGGQTFTVNGLSLQVSDQLYTSKPTGYFCNAIAAGQIQIQMVDYGKACYLDRNPADPDPRDPGVNHTELDIILGVGGHPNNMIPYTVSKVDCAVGPGDNGTAYFKHFAPNATDPDSNIQVDSGTVKIDQYDPTNKLPVKGHFDLVFGGAKVSGTLETYDCDPT
jgi:hypothetical protein